MEYQTQYNIVSRARARLILDQPFFGVLASQLALKIDATCDTAWTDGTSIAFSPAFVDSHTSEQLLAVYAHEVMHCACGHPWRRDHRDAKRWNVATDYAINAILTNAGFTLPADVLLDAKYSGQSAEWIYDRLPQDNQQQPQPQQSDQGQDSESDDTGGLGEVRDAPQGEQSDAQGQPIPTQSQADWNQATIQAKQLAQAQGSLGSGTARAIGQATKQPADWRSLLRKYVQEVVRSDYSWNRPNVRYVQSGLYLPALHATACGPIAVCVDTSGSIDEVLLAQFGKEIDAIASEVQPAYVDVIYCDAEVNRTERFERGDAITLQACGGGGTDFRPAFAHVDTLDTPPAVTIYLTDLMGTFPDHAPEYPVIWAVYGSDAETYGYVPTFGDMVPCQ
jgi:predicted metal-dependent peptidase